MQVLNIPLSQHFEMKYILRTTDIYLRYMDSSFAMKVIFGYIIILG